MRVCSFGLLTCVILSAPLCAEEWKGSVKTWDSAGKRLIVSSAGKDYEVDVPAETRIVDARGGDVEALRDRALQTRPAVKVTGTTREGGIAAQSIRLTNYFLPRPDEFYLDSANAGADFLIQGEYAGEISGHGKFGAHVAAKENGQFSVLFLPGGLPGAGLEPKSKIISAGAVTTAGKTTIAGVWSGQIEAGKLTGKTAAGKPFMLTRVQRQSPTLGAKPPAQAIVLFDGGDTAKFVKATMSDDGLLKVPAVSKQFFKDFHLHLEFLIPYRGPSGGNSGVYVQNCYEIQVFDSFGGQRSPSGCGGIYVFRAPDVNASLPPLTWQTFDVDFSAARFDAEGQMLERPVATVRHNGVVIHDNVTLPEKGNGGRPTGAGGPLFLQAHGSPVRYRNIWVVERP